MYLWIVVLLLIFLTMFYYMREGLESEHILDKSTILATETEVQLPNRVSGIRGNDLTFTGDIHLENAHSLELGKGVEKGINSGKIRYHDDNLEIFGAGQEDKPYKVKLWDNVEVGGLLQVNQGVQFGKDTTQGGIQYDTEGKVVNLRGYGKDGTRQVKIWDDVEVGKLISKKGSDVYGALNAYNVLNVAGPVNTGSDLNVRGKMIGKKGMSVIGDVDITGNIANPPLNNRINLIEKNLTENMNKNSTLEVGIIPGLKRQIDDLKEKNAEVMNNLDRVQDKLREVSQRTPEPLPTTMPPLPTVPSVPVAQFNASLEQLKLDLQREIASATTNMMTVPTTIPSGPTTAPVGINSADLDDWVNTRNKLFSTPEKVEAWNNLNVMGLSRLTDTQITNLEPLKNSKFNKNLLEIGNNVSVDYKLLADIASDGSLDYFKDLDAVVEYNDGKIKDVTTKMTKLNDFSNEWLDDSFAANNTNKLKDRINSINSAINNITMNSNTNDSINDLTTRITNLDNVALKKDGNGNVQIPGKLMLGNVAGQIWNFIAGPTMVGVTKQT